MVRLTITPAIQEAIGYIGEIGQEMRWIEDKDEVLHTSPSVGKPISHIKILEISKRLREFAESQGSEFTHRTPPYRVDSLLRGSKVYIEPPKPKVEPTSEYKALMSRLRREEEAREYERMVNPPLLAETFAQRFPGSQGAHLFPTSQADIGEDDEISFADINRQMALIANVLISILACSVAIWIAAKYWNTPARLALSMGGSTLVGVAEVVVYAAYLGRLKEARRKGKKEVEIREVIKTWVIGSEVEKPDQYVPRSVAQPNTQDNLLRRRKPVQT